MRAVRNAPPTVEVVEVDEPQGDGELIRVAATGICASDLNYLDYGSTQIAGHEFAGTLEVADAFLVEPASVARHACHMGAVGPGTRVAVVGAGAIGILTAASAQAMDAPEVAVEARHPHQHEARERLGVGTPTGDYDVVVETGGSESALHRAVELARPGGTV